VSFLGVPGMHALHMLVGKVPPGELSGPCPALSNPWVGTTTRLGQTLSLGSSGLEMHKEFLEG
jgi:hypothetical protein